MTQIKVWDSRRIRRDITQFYLCLVLLLLLPSFSSAQLVIGQYEDEAPLRSWNIFGFQTAPSLGRGDTSFALAADSSSGLTNPALLLDLPRFTITLNGTSASTSLYRYSIVNTGVLATEGNVSIDLYSLDFGGISFTFKGWAFAVSAALSEVYDRPPTGAQLSYFGRIYETLNFSQTGYLRIINFALARKLGRIFRVGLGFNVIQGELTRDIEDQYPPENITISDNKAQDFSGFYLNGGICARLSDAWALAFIFRTPFTKESKSTSALRYFAPRGGTDIRIEASAADTYKQPLVVGLGACYKFSANHRMTADLAYFNWSKYQVTSFEEEQVRNFRDTFKLGLGAEFSFPFRLFKRNSFFVFRMGAALDQQPMRDPHSVYYSLTGGAGLHWDKVYLDLGGSYSQERGSGRNLTAGRLALSLGFGL